MFSRIAKAVPRIHVRVEITAIFALAVIIGTFGYSFHNVQKRSIELDVHQHLREVAALKASEISTWRRERLADARVAATLAGVADDVSRELGGHADARTTRNLTRWLDSIRSSYGYASVAMTDAGGNPRLTAGQPMASAETYREAARAAAADGSASFHEYGPGNGVAKPHLVLAAGLASESGERIGALLLGIDPAVYLYPSVLHWPTPTRTGQVILLQRDQNDVVFLNDIEGVPGSAMSLRRSLSNRASPSVRAATGETEVDGTIADAGGHTEQVEGAAQRVPDSDWFVVANMHADEAYERLHQISRAIWIFGGMFLLLMSASIEVLRRRQQSRFYQRLYQSELEKQALRGQHDFLTRYANDAILLVDDSRRIVEANDRAIEYFGYTRQELLNLDVRKLRVPETRSQFDSTWNALHEKKSLLYELELQRKDGTRFPAEASARLIEVEGRPLFQGILRDITERKQAEAQIRRLNRLYLVLSRCHQAVIEAETETDLFKRVCAIAVDQGGLRGALAYVNDHDGSEPRVAAAAGADMRFLDAALFDEFGASKDFAICNDISAQPELADWKHTAAQQKARSWIALPLKRTGATVGRLSLFSAERFFFSAEEIALAQEIAASISFALDAQERERLRRQAEDQLSHSRERLELVLEATNEGYWDWNLVTGEGHQSLRYYAILGSEPGRLRADFPAWQELVHPDDQAALRMVMEAIGKQDAFSLELRVRHSDGHYIWCLWRGKVVARSQNGVPVRLVGTTTDITERKRLEEQFLQAQKLESVGQLAGGVAHDFNNLLTVINGYGDLLLARMSKVDALRPMVKHIKEAGESAAGLTRQLLAFSRKQLSEPKTIHLNAVLEDAKSIFGRLVSEDIEIVTRFWASPDYVLADRNQIHQCVMNLVVNARDAMPNGGRLTIETVNSDRVAADLIPDAGTQHTVTKHTGAKAGSWVVLSVTDTGTGMDEATRGRIFEPFFTTKEVGKGTGLGLATVYGIVRQCNGLIRVESEPGRGTSFRIYLPLTEAGDEAADTVPTPARAGGLETVMIVEDQDNVRGFLAETLSDLGYSVLLASTGAEALELGHRYKGAIDVLLTDIVMPGMNGKDLAQALKTEWPWIKVVFMSGYPGDAISDVSALDPGVAHVQKPFSPETISAKLREVLSARPSPAAAD